MFEVECGKCGKKISIYPMSNDSKYIGNGVHYCNKCVNELGGLKKIQEELGIEEVKEEIHFSIVSFLLKILSVVWFVSTILSENNYSDKIINNPMLVGITISLLLWAIAIFIDRLSQIIFILSNKK